MAELEPILLTPSGKDYLWGGARLNTEFSKNINLFPLAETWECSTHPDGPSTIALGKYEGMSLIQYIKDNPEVLGSNILNNSELKHDELPILIKFIDAKRDLSVQVHPDDVYARNNENGSLGKNEVWYVLDAEENTKLVYGFNNNMSVDLLKQSIMEGTLEKYLHKVNVKKGDLFFIPAGTVHAIGAGALIAEIQENSNLTYRLYDYDRVDKNGKKRELHIDKAIDVVNLKFSNFSKNSLRKIEYKKGCVSEFLCSCKYFKIDKITINTSLRGQLGVLRTSSRSFQVLLCIEGCGIVKFGKDFSESFLIYKGDCIFVPANAKDIQIHGIATFLKVIC